MPALRLHLTWFPLAILCACAGGPSARPPETPPPVPSEDLAQGGRLPGPSAAQGPTAPLRNAASAAALESQVQQGFSQLSADRLEEALATFESVLQQEPAHAKARQGAKETRQKLAARVFDSAEGDLQAGRLGAALLGFLRAEQLDPGNPRAARNQADGVRAKLLDELTFYIELPEVLDRARSPEVSERLTPGRLGTALPRGVPLRIVPPPSEASIGVRASVTVERVETLYERRLLTRTVQVPLGRRKVENPDWRKLEDTLWLSEKALGEAEGEQWVRIEQLHQAERKLDDARRMFERCQVASVASCAEALRICRNAVGTSSCDVPTTCDADACRLFAEPSSNAEQAYNQSRVQLRASSELLRKRRDEALHARELRMRTPVLTEEPVFGEFPYEVEVHTATSRAAVTFQLDPLAPQSPHPNPETRDFLARSEDQTHRAYELYGVSGDPLELEPEKELKRKAGDEALEGLSQVVRESFDAYRSPRREEARRALSRQGLTPEVLERVVRAALLYPDERPNDLLDALVRHKKLGAPPLLYAH